jgi:hypothetical protein
MANKLTFIMMQRHQRLYILVFMSFLNSLKYVRNVVTRSLVLFPASLTHYMIPFEAEEERIVLAFDVKQK